MSVLEETYSKRNGSSDKQLRHRFCKRDDYLIAGKVPSLKDLFERQ